MQKNIVTKTFSTRRNSTGVDKRNGKKFCKSLRVMVICKFNKYIYEAKKCCNKNYWESFKCKQQHTMFMKQQTRDLLLKIAEVV